MVVNSSVWHQVGPYTYSECEDAVLGRGHFGHVFRGIDSRSRMEVAVKKIDSSKIKAEELKILEGICSDFVVRLLGQHSADGFTYLVLELCDCDLATYLERVHSLRTENLNILTDCLARGYEVLNRMEIIHRDIKPQNVLLRFDWTDFTANNSHVTPRRRIKCAKFSDFGISREVKKGSGITLSNLAGTPLYMAPEIGANILDSSAYDAQVDMWSIGVMLNQCITGEEPFDERALCKLFLFAVNKNYFGYTAPALPKTAPEKYHILNARLLELDAERRMQPLEFYNFVVNGHLTSRDQNFNQSGCKEAEKEFTNDTTGSLSNRIAGTLGKIIAFLLRRDVILSTILFAGSFCFLPRFTRIRTRNGVISTV